MEKIKLTDELIAAFLEGTASDEEVALVLAAARRDPRLAEVLAVASPESERLPMQALAATSEKDTLCTVRCEQFVLQAFGRSVPLDVLVREAGERGWLTGDGVPLFRMGSLSASHGLGVQRRYGATLEELEGALSEGYQVIVAVDGGEIDGDPDSEEMEDRFIGQMPDHAVVVLSVSDEVVCYNPFRGDVPQCISRKRFVDAWEDSKFYMIMISTLEKAAAAYTPSPLDLSDVTLPESLSELTEAIAENTHEIWSKGRMDEGWTYGPVRDDALLKHPDLIPYSCLTDGEKEYDRATAMNAIKLIVKLGYKIEKI